MPTVCLCAAAACGGCTSGLVKMISCFNKTLTNLEFGKKGKHFSFGWGLRRSSFGWWIAAVPKRL